MPKIKITCRECPYKETKNGAFVCFLSGRATNITKHVMALTTPKWCDILAEAKEQEDAKP